MAKGEPRVVPRDKIIDRLELISQRLRAARAVSDGNTYKLLLRRADQWLDNLLIQMSPEEIAVNRQRAGLDP